MKNARLYFFITLMILQSCSSQKALEVNYHSKNIYDIQVNSGKIYYYCTEPEKNDEPGSWLGIYLFSDNEVILFYTRRKLAAQECKIWKNEIDAIYNDSTKLRLVGIEGDEEPFEDRDIAKMLKLPGPVKVSSSWFLSRIVTDKGCVGHFGEECEPGYSEKNRFNNP